MSTASVKFLTVTELTIAIATGPSGGLSLEREIRLVKPALLYADRVTLISPVASLLQATVDVGSSEQLAMTLFREVGPKLEPEVAEAFAYYDNLRSKRRPTRKEIREMADFRYILSEASAEVLERAQRQNYDFDRVHTGRLTRGRIPAKIV